MHVRTGKVATKKSKMRQKSIRKSMKNQYKNHARKGGTKRWNINKVIQKGRKNEQKLGPPKSERNIRKKSKKKAIDPERDSAVVCREHYRSKIEDKLTEENILTKER